MLTTNRDENDAYKITCTLPKYNSIRTISFGDNILQELLKIRQYQKEKTYQRDDCYLTYSEGNDLQQVQKQKLPEGQELVHPICLRKNGRMFNEDSVADHYQRVSKNTGIPFTSHTLRHSNATLLYENHVPLKVISARLGTKT